MSIELPPLPNPPLEYRHEGCTYIDRESFLEWHDQHSARERILLARVAELEAALDAVIIRTDSTSLGMGYDIWKIANAARQEGGGMTTLEELNRDCPEHDRTSCSDAKPINAGIDYRYGTVWCRRCQGLWQIKAEAALAERVEVGRGR